MWKHETPVKNQIILSKHNIVHNFIASRFSDFLCFSQHSQSSLINVMSSSVSKCLEIEVLLEIRYNSTRQTSTTGLDERKMARGEKKVQERANGYNEYKIIYYIIDTLFFI